MLLHYADSRAYNVKFSTATSVPRLALVAIALILVSYILESLLQKGHLIA